MSALSDIVAKFRKSSPNIAAAFDEVERRLVALEQPAPPPPPPSPYGTKLHEGFEWCLAEGSNVVTVSTLDALRQSNNTKLTMLEGASIGGTRVLKTNANPWRLRGCTITNGSPEDNIKGDGARFLDIDRCDINHAPRQGVLAGLGGFSDVVIRNSRIHDNGTSGTFDHGAYIGYGSRLLIYNCVIENNAAYQLHLYPQYTDVLVSCCTMRGGIGSIVSGARNVRFIGCRFDNSTRYGLEQYGTITNVTVQDCAGSGNALGAHSVPGASVSGWGATVVRDELRPWVPHGSVGSAVV